MPRELVIYRGKRYKLAIAFPWFLLIGWWVGLMTLFLAWFLALSIIGIPIAFALVDRLPAVLTRRASTPPPPAAESARRRLLRAGYFALIGVWLSAFWILLALLVNYIVLLIGDRIATQMVERVPRLATLSNAWS